jgi:predicted ABC-type ATPase
VVKKNPAPCIYVLAGTNGAGKSSIVGATIRDAGSEYFNPDEATRQILAANPGFSLEDANSAAWYEGKRLLEWAIAERLDFTFETTLGGKTIAGLLKQALAEKIEVRMWYVGLGSLELHIERIRARVARGGHDIPEPRVRQRYQQGILNLIDLLPLITELLVYDNSEEADPQLEKMPEPKLLLHLDRGQIVSSCDLTLTPRWAKPILGAALKLTRTRS